MDVIIFPTVVAVSLPIKQQCKIQIIFIPNSRNKVEIYTETIQVSHQTSSYLRSSESIYLKLENRRSFTTKNVYRIDEDSQNFFAKVKLVLENETPAINPSCLRFLHQIIFS